MLRLFALLLFLPVAALAQLAAPMTPTVQNGYGTLSVTNASAALSTVTAGPNSNTWPTLGPNGTIVVSNTLASAGYVYVCMLGGTCTSSNGWPVSAGQTLTFNIVGRATSPTIIAATTATVLIGW